LRTQKTPYLIGSIFCGHSLAFPGVPFYELMSVAAAARGVN
jgi:hypothetical protein